MRSIDSAFSRIILTAGLIPALFPALTSAKVELKPLHAGFAVEYGQLNDLIYFEPNSAKKSFTINRTIGWISQEATINDRLDANLALGGLFFHFFPYDNSFLYSKVRNSAVSIGQASAKYNFGEIGNPTFSISAGLMPYKYNPDSKNLGEYLFRSTPYPSTTINGSWDLINSSYSKVKGALAEYDLFEGRWKNDFLLSINDETYPLHDLSLAYVTSYKLGALELGGGVNFNNVLPNSPSVSTPKNTYNSYFTYQGKVYFGDDIYYKGIAQFFALEAAKKRLGTTPADAASVLKLEADSATYQNLGNLVDSLNHADTAGAPTRLSREYYTYKGALLMGRASLDVGSFIAENMDFKVYTEVDVLGWTNYPIFYEKRSDRMPFMAGLTIPTFGILDNLAIEVEYWKNPYPVMNVKALDSGNPTLDYKLMSAKIDITKPYTKDDLKWSVYAKKTIGKYFTVNAQVANDHTRPIRYDFSPYKYETMLDKKAWYYIVQLQVNM
jgi:hypothetical protein